MTQSKLSNITANLKYDIPASIVVFLVAMPLCLGIALASGAPPFAGLIAGIVGGIVIGSLSGSSLGVSGPAAGLAVIVANAIEGLGSYELFLTAVVLAGIIQVVMGFIRAGIIAYYFPSSVIHGMLSGIGILIFLKQIPHAVGYDKDPEGDLAFKQVDGENTFSELFNMLNFIDNGVVIITAVSLGILLLWETKLIKNNSVLKRVPGPFLAVLAGVLINVAFIGNPSFEIAKDHLVNIPMASSAEEFFGNFTFPNFSGLQNPDVYVTAIL
ncbi:MAG: SulP family inorganic anion transporter, partial [Schleiferiaceae bacterium]|nr:SulP family inorganic anion transporter [Schleiferiaceae bacterium]